MYYFSFQNTVLRTYLGSNFCWPFFFPFIENIWEANNGMSYVFDRREKKKISSFGNFLISFSIPHFLILNINKLVDLKDKCNNGKNDGKKKQYYLELPRNMSPAYICVLFRFRHSIKDAYMMIMCQVLLKTWPYGLVHFLMFND